MPRRRSQQRAEVQPLVQPDCQISQRVHRITVQLNGFRGSEFFRPSSEFVVFHFVGVLRAAAGRRTGSTGSIFIKRPRDRGKERAPIPETIAPGTQMRAVDRKHRNWLHFLSPHPTRNIRRLAVPRARERIAISRQPRRLFRVVVQTSKRNPSTGIFPIAEAGEHKSNQRIASQYFWLLR